MSDGYFNYPDDSFLHATDVSQLKDIAVLEPDHPWIEAQVNLVKELTEAFGGDRHTFYNIFSPATYFKIVRNGGEKVLLDFIHDDALAVTYVLETVSRSLSILVRRVIEEGGASGIYFSTQDLDTGPVSDNLFDQVISRPDTRILEEALAAGGLNILHICGYEGHRNRLERFTAYPAQIVNWSVTSEQFTLEQGLELFHDKAVLGGFDNTVDGILYRGSREAIEQETRRIIAGSGTRRVILGADCTIPRDIDLRHLQWVRESARLI